MTWQTVRDAVVAAFEGAMPAATLSTCHIGWGDDRQAFAQHRVLLDIVSATPLVDRDTSLYQGGDQELDSVLSIVLQARFESSFDSADIDALWLCETVRLGLRKVSVYEALVAAGVRITRFPGVTQRLSYKADGRIISSHAFDFEVRARFTFDATGEDAGLIETIEGVGTYVDEDDTSTMAAFSVTDLTPEP